MPPLNDIAAIVGIVGASVAATLAVVKYLDTRREKRRRITVTVTHGMPFNIPGVHNDLVLVEAANPGSQPVTLTSWGFLLGDGRTLVSFAHIDGTVRLPYKLLSGESCKMWMEKPSLTESLLEAGFEGTVKLIGFYTDALGTKHKSAEVFNFDLPHST